MIRTAHIDPRLRPAAAWVLIPAVLLFGLGGALEIFHPVEEGDSPIAAHHVVDESRDGVHAHDAPGFDHEHLCAHSNALASVAGPRSSFRPLTSFLGRASEPVDRTVSDILSVLARGPPVLL